MIKEDYVSFETAKLLKEKGFDEACNRVYQGSNLKYTDIPVSSLMSLEELGGFHQKQLYVHNKELGDIVYTAPTLQMAMKWLREIYKIHIIAEPCLGEGSEQNLSFNRWFWTILKEEGEYKPVRKIDEFSSYEEAIKTAIEYCLKKLI